jgi:hypothetical protein
VPGWTLAQFFFLGARDSLLLSCDLRQARATSPAQFGFAAAVLAAYNGS